MVWGVDFCKCDTNCKIFSTQTLGRIELTNYDEVVLTDAHRDQHLVNSLLLAVKEDRPPQADQKVRILLNTKFNCTVSIVPIHQIQINVNCISR